MTTTNPAQAAATLLGKAAEANADFARYAREGENKKARGRNRVALRLAREAREAAAEAGLEAADIYHAEKAGIMAGPSEYTRALIEASTGHRPQN